jgi:hypothetical protein
MEIEYPFPGAQASCLQLPPTETNYLSGLINPTTIQASVNMRRTSSHFLPAVVNIQGIVVWVRFVSLTGKHVTRELIFQGAEKHGTFGWEHREATIKAPEHAGRFALFFGISACRGEARSADIRINALWCHVDSFLECAASLLMVLSSTLESSQNAWQWL